MSRSFWLWFMLICTCPSDPLDASSSMEGAIMFMDGQTIYPDESVEQSDWSPICTHWGEPVPY